MKKWLNRILSLVVFSAMLAACSTTGQPGGETAKDQGEVADITVLLGKPEIAREFEETVNEFNRTHPNYRVSVIPLAGQNAYEKMTSLYASGNAPTIMMMGQEFAAFKDKLLDLTNEPWVKHALPGTTEFVTVDGKIYGMPVTVEAFAFIYNKRILDQATGGSFDPSSVKTRDDLKRLFDQVAALDGIDSIHISPMDWSLGAHFTNVFYAAQSDDRAKRHQFMKDLKAGTVKLAENGVFHGWLDTFDLMKEYNAEKKSPLAPQYDDGPLALAGGKVGFWFMGNWAYPQLKEIDPEGEYGFLPVPVSNQSGDYGNSQISVGVPSYWSIDASQSTPAEQQGAKEFLNWLVSSETGQDYYVNKLNLIPVFDNFSTKPQDSLSRNILSYMDSGKTLEFMCLYYPPDGWPAMGAALQKYLAGEIDRAQLSAEFENYWKQVK